MNRNLARGFTRLLAVVIITIMPSGVERAEQLERMGSWTYLVNGGMYLMCAFMLAPDLPRTKRDE